MTADLLMPPASTQDLKPKVQPGTEPAHELAPTRFVTHDRDGDPENPTVEKPTQTTAPALAPTAFHLSRENEDGGYDYEIASRHATTSPAQEHTPELDDDSPELAPVAEHYLLPDGKGGVDYASFTDDTANPDTIDLNTASLGHWMDRDSQGTLHYVSHPGIDTPADTLAHSGRPPLAFTVHDRTRGTLFIAALWPCILNAGGPRPAHLAHHHFTNIYHPRELAALELPGRDRIPNGQRVTLAAEGFERFPDQTAAHAAYQHDPRTWIFEEAHTRIPWLNIAAAHLTSLTQSPHDVIAAVYDSLTADRPSAPHRDAWYSAVIQFDGTKQWSIGPDAHQVTTQPGDVLLIPEGLTHAVTTPAEPGHSRHLVFDIGAHPMTAPGI